MGRKGGPPPAAQALKKGAAGHSRTRAHYVGARLDIDLTANRASPRSLPLPD